MITGIVTLADAGFLPRWILAAVAGAVVVWLLQKGGRKPARQQDGWTTLVPGTGLWGFAAFCAVFAGLLGFVTFDAVGDALADRTGKPDWSRLLVPPVIAALALFSAGYIGAVRFRFDTRGVDRVVLHRRVFIAWEEIEKIERHWFWGMRIHCRNGKRYCVWEFFRGFQNFVESARKHGVKTSL